LVTRTGCVGFMMSMFVNAVPVKPPVFSETM
jgi:hypothetical protein